MGPIERLELLAHNVVWVLADGQSSWEWPRLPTYHVVLVGRTEGSVWGDQDYPHSVPGGFGRTDGPVYGGWHRQCKLPSTFKRTDDLVWGGWYCPHTLPC